MTGILVSLVGVLGGLALALYYRSEMFKERGNKRLLSGKLDAEVAAHDATLTKATADADLYVDDAARKEELIAYYEQRSHEARIRRLDKASPKELRAVANALYPNVSDGMRLDHSYEDSGSGEVADEDSDDSRTVSSETTTE